MPSSTWWKRTGVYVVLALILAAMHAAEWLGPRRAHPSPLAEEQRLLQSLDERMTPSSVGNAIVQRPALGIALAALLLSAFGVWVAGCVLLTGWWMGGRPRLPFAAITHALPAVWSIGDVARIAILGLVAAHLLPVAQLAVRHSRLAPRQPPDLHAWMLLSMLALDGTVLLAVLVMAARRRGGSWARAIGWRTRHWWQSAWQGVVGYVAAVPPLSAAILVVFVAAHALRYQPPPEPVLGLLLNESRWPVLLATSFFIAILGPVVEETFFRGVVYAALRRRWGARWGIVVSSAGFAALHATPAGFLPIWLLGAALAYLYEATGSLVPSMALHMIHNTVILAGVWLTRGLLGAM